VTSHIDLYVERGVKPRRIDAATRVGLALLSRLFSWRRDREFESLPFQQFSGTGVQG
jgi:hypothetical protein